jgi:hypothetical protein
MEKDCKNLLMEDPTKEIGLMVLCMAEDIINGLLVNNTKANTI